MKNQATAIQINHATGRLHTVYQNKLRKLEERHGVQLVQPGSQVRDQTGKPILMKPMSRAEALKKGILKLKTKAQIIEVLEGDNGRHAYFDHLVTGNEALRRANEKTRAKAAKAFNKEHDQLLEAYENAKDKILLGKKASKLLKIVQALQDMKV